MRQKWVAGESDEIGFARNHHRLKIAEEMCQVIYELREYTPMPGRLKDAIDLFKTVVIPLFRRHGMEIVQAGYTTIGDNAFNELVYTMRFSNLADLERKWKAFLTDPDWSVAFAEREQSGPLYHAIRRRTVDASPFDELLNGGYDRPFTALTAQHSEQAPA